MQTFLPFDDFNECARVLDRARLGKQCVECGQIYNALMGKSKGWRNHPATKMWKGHEDALKAYWFTCATEWGQRGYNGHMRVFDLHIPLSFGVPRWLGNPKLHSSHRAALLAKLPDHYGQFDWSEKPIVDYWWPTKNGY